MSATKIYGGSARTIFLSVLHYRRKRRRCPRRYTRTRKQNPEPAIQAGAS